MTALYVLDVPENVPLATVAGADPAVTVSKIGPVLRDRRRRGDLDRPAGHRLPARGLVQQHRRAARGAHHPARQGRAARGARLTADTGRPGAGRLGAGRWIDAAEPPSATVTSVHQLTTSDGASVSGVLRTVPGARTVVCLMHPRQDVTHHVLVPELLMRGFAVWTQGSRSVNNDLVPGARAGPARRRGRAGLPARPGFRRGGHARAFRRRDTVRLLPPAGCLAGRRAASRAPRPGGRPGWPGRTCRYRTGRCSWRPIRGRGRCCSG